MEDKELQETTEKKAPGCLAFVVGGMSFIPLIGVIFGIISIIWGFSIKNGKLKIVGVAGIAFTIILYSGLGYFGFVQEGGVYDDLRAELAKSQLTSAVQAIEFYKAQNNHYPENLEVVHESQPENSMVFLHDPTQVAASEPAFFFYKLIDQNTYHIRALGRDGAVGTEDDVIPAAINNTGLVDSYEVSSF